MLKRSGENVVVTNYQTFKPLTFNRRFGGLALNSNKQTEGEKNENLNLPKIYRRIQ
jgi:hypothetical protein